MTVALPDAAALDAADPLAPLRERFLPTDAVAYLDGNSLGRPLGASAERLRDAVEREWAGRLIRGWDDGWLDLPLAIGDDLGRVVLGAAPGQVVVGDSTSVLLYKLIRAGLALAAGRDEIVLSRDDFPTDRYVLEGIAAETGATLRWVEGDPAPDAVAALLGERTALVVLSHVGYRSGALVDAASVTALARAAGALTLWDLSHSAGVVPVDLDGWGADLAVGCGYKYLNGGPGAPAFAYVAARHLGLFRQPIQGWLGSASPFEMGQGYRPAEGIRRVLSGTPPILGMQALRPAIALIEEAGMPAIRAKSAALTTLAIELADALLPDALLATPRDPARRGGHITLDQPGFERIMPALWARGVIPDFRRPSGIRLGLSPLSTSFDEVEVGIRAIAEELGAR
ncbi:MAG: aminotransferase class V-fold PLP-dependent enzyme [Micrococcales bacterium]|nr:aminotransferase class V-fold PLP-dependent enzyme [Micrococcales bacterium]